MSTRSLRILHLFDAGFAPSPDYDFAEEFKDEDWKTERDVLRAMEKLGHEVIPFGLFDSIKPLIEILEEKKPHLVFNMCESFGDNRDHEPHVIGLLELMGIKYTGASPTALRLCKDKGLTKKIATYHRIRIPKFITSHRSRPTRSLKRFPYPAIVKPLELEASEGISQMSLVDSEADCLERIRFLHDKFSTDVIVEEFIEGRELYVGILGNERLTVFPPQELFFKEVPEGEPKFATYKAKWDNNYREKWGIDSAKAKPIDPAILKKINETCKKIYRQLQMRGYGRIDLRLRDSGEVVFIEANPNPAIARDDDFAKSAKQAEISYEDLIARIVSLGLNE